MESLGVESHAFSDVQLMGLCNDVMGMHFLYFHRYNLEGLTSLDSCSLTSDHVHGFEAWDETHLLCSDDFQREAFKEDLWDGN